MDSLGGADGGKKRSEHGKRPSRKRGSDQFLSRGRTRNKLTGNDVIVRPKLRKSVSDPLNLEGRGTDVQSNSGFASPAYGPGDQPSPLPLQLQNDPLNLEEKLQDFVHVMQGIQMGKEKRKRPREADKGGKKKWKGRKRKKSQCEDSNGDGVESSSSAVKVDTRPCFQSKAAMYRYGNYDMYYGYRNHGAFEEDPRLSMMNKEWFRGKVCLDIGSNTGQVTLAIAREFAPARITGIDIDSKLVRIAWKNLQRSHPPARAPDGRPFPQSFFSFRGPMGLLLSSSSSSIEAANEHGFPHNVEFIEGNYVPENEDEVLQTQPEYDVILCLSLTKWVHLNWGDDGLRRMFRKIVRHLLPGGKLILEPQPWQSYARRKKLTEKIHENYQKIWFHPDQFHAYLMSPEVGFVEHKFLGVPSNRNEGFRRPIHMYTKGILSSPVDLPLPAPPLFTSTLVARPLPTGQLGLDPQKANAELATGREGSEVNVPVITVTPAPIL